MFYDTNGIGYHTTWIQDGVTLMVTNGTTSVTAAMQVGGTTGGDVTFSNPSTNTITGNGGTLLVLGNSENSGFANQLNFQVRQCASPAIPSAVTLDMSGLGTLIATVGKFYVAQGGSGGAQSNVSGCVYLARTNVITCLRPNAGQFEVGDSSGGAFTLPGSSLYLGITNAFFMDTARFGKQRATNNLLCFNPALTNIAHPVVYVRNTNGPASRVTTWTVGDADTETAHLPVFVSTNVDFSGGTVDALIGTALIGQGSTATGDTGGYAQGTMTLTAGILDVTTLRIGVQRAVHGSTETGTLNINGTATLASTNIILAQLATGGNASLVNGILNVTNGTVRGNIFAGGGTSTVNVIGGTLIVSNNAGTAAAPLTALSLTGASVHFKVDGNVTSAPIAATAASASGTTIRIDSVANIAGPTLIHLLCYTGTDPFGGLSLAPLPPGFTGNLVDNSGSVDLNVNVSAAPPSPTIRTITVSGGQVILSGTNNFGTSGTYHLLSSTNFALPLTNWTVLANGSFDGNGNFSLTNSSGTNGQRFFILQVP